MRDNNTMNKKIQSEPMAKLARVVEVASEKRVHSRADHKVRATINRNTHGQKKRTTTGAQR